MNITLTSLADPGDIGPKLEVRLRVERDQVAQMIESDGEEVDASLEYCAQLIVAAPWSTREVGGRLRNTPGTMSFDLLLLSASILRVIDRKNTVESFDPRRLGLARQDPFTVYSGYFVEAMGCLFVVFGTEELEAEDCFKIEVHFGYADDSPPEIFTLFVGFEAGETFARALASASDRFDDLPPLLSRDRLRQVPIPQEFR